MKKMTSLTEVFFANAKKHPTKRAFYYCRNRDFKWVEMSWKKYREEVVCLATWLSEEGVKKGDRVALISANRPEWLITELAILSLGAVSVPIYATSSAHDITHPRAFRG